MCRRQKLGATQFLSPTKLGKWQSQETAVLGEIFGSIKTTTKLVLSENCAASDPCGEPAKPLASRPHFSIVNLRAVLFSQQLIGERFVET
jgi:hypothetical protein